MRAGKRFAALTAAILTALSGAALAQEYDAQQAKSWMAQFAQALLQFSPVNDPAQTLDPARPGEYLQEYRIWHGAGGDKAARRRWRRLRKST